MPGGNGEFVSKGECNAKFDQLINLFQLSDKKIDKLADNFGKLSDSFIEFKASREPILEKIKTIEDERKAEKEKAEKDKTDELDKLRTAPERRKVDRRWLIVLFFTIFFSMITGTVAIISLVHQFDKDAKTQSVQAVRTPEPTEEQVYGP